MQAGVVVGSFDPINVGNLYEGNRTGAFDHEPLGFVRVGVPLSNAVTGSINSTIKAVVIKGFQQVIQSAGLKGLQRVLVVGGYEYDCRRKFTTQEFQHIEAIALWHLNVEKDQVRAEFA